MVEDEQVSGSSRKSMPVSHIMKEIGVDMLVPHIRQEIVVEGRISEHEEEQIDDVVQVVVEFHQEVTDAPVEEGAECWYVRADREPQERISECTGGQSGGTLGQQVIGGEDGHSPGAHFRAHRGAVGRGAAASNGGACVRTLQVSQFFPNERIFERMGGAERENTFTSVCGRSRC